MADSVVWAPIRDFDAAFVPKTSRGMRLWTVDGPSDPDLPPDPPDPRRSTTVYQWRGPKLCVTCNGAD